MTDAHLDRKLTLFPVTNIVIANMIGAGIFTTSGLLMQDLQNPLLMLLLWLVGGIIALCGALSYGELGAAYPRAGGEYAFLSQLYHPMLGFLSGWVSLIAGFSAPIAASAIGFSEYLFRAFPQFSEYFVSNTIISEIWIKRLISVAVILLFTGIHLRGIRFGARVQNWLTLLKILLIVGLIFAGFTFGKGDWAHLSSDQSLIPSSLNWKTIGLSLMWIMFAYSGWNAATYIGSEIQNPKKNLPYSLLLGTGMVMILYFLINLFYIYAVEPAEMKGVISISGLAAAKAFGGAMDSAISVMIAFALFSSLSAFLILGPRVYYAMARDHVFFKSLSDVDFKFHVPRRAIVLQSVIASLIALTGTFDQILTYMGFSLGIFPVFAVFGIFKLRRTKQSILPQPGFPITSLIYIIAGLSILILAFMERPVESILALVTVSLGIPVYYYFRRQKNHAVIK
ncbi:MAG: amino acid permease [Calditrichaceae bacterium]|nr:amino acid permease [Calditrichaceae bacterium]